MILLHLVSSFLHIKSSFVPYTYVSFESIYCILLFSLALNAVLLTSSVNTLSSSLLNLCCDYKTDLLLFINYL